MLHVVMPINANDYNMEITPIITKLFTGCTVHAILMGTNTNDYLFALPTNIDKLITVEAPYDESTCIKKGIDSILAITSDITDTIVISNVNYLWSPLQVKPDLPKIAKSGILVLNILKDITGNPDIEASCGVPGSAIANKMRNMQKSEDTFEIIDKLMVMKPINFKRILKSIGDKNINTNSIYEASKELNLPEHKCRVDGMVFRPNDVEMPIITKPGEYKHPVSIEPSPEIKIIDPVKDLFAEETTLPTKMINCDVSADKYNITITFNYNSTENQRFSSREDTWKTLTTLFNSNGKYNIYISGAYPFSKDNLLKSDCVKFLDEMIVPNSVTQQEKMMYLFANSDMVVSKNPEFVINALAESTKVLFYGSEQDVELIKKSTSNTDKSLYRLIINPNPNVHPVVIFDEIRDFIGEKKKVR